MRQNVPAQAGQIPSQTGRVPSRARSGGVSPKRRDGPSVGRPRYSRNPSRHAMAEATMAPETMDNGRRAEGAYRLQRAGGSGSCSPDSDASLRNARLTQALVRRSSPPATNKELYAGPPTSVAVTSPMCAVSVRRLPNRDFGTCGALPVSISGISVSPTARPKPRMAAVSSQRREAGSTRQASVWERVKPRAAAVMRTSFSFVRMAESMTRTIVGRMSRASIRAAESQQRPEPFPAASRTMGTSRKTAAKP